MKYIFWRFTKAIIGYWKIIGRFCLYFMYIAGIRLLIRTLFWPWKRDVEIRTKQAFDINDWINRHVFNGFSRLIGFLIKTFTIILWLGWELIWLLGSIIFFPIWLFSPLVALALLINIVSSVEVLNATLLQENINEVLFLLVKIVLLFFLFFLEITLYKSRQISRLLEVDPRKPDPQDPWFSSLSAHLLLDPASLKEVWMSEKLKDVLVSSHLSRVEFDRLTAWEINRQIDFAKRQSWWSRENLFEKRPFTEDWVYGWTFTLNNFSRNLNYRNDGSVTIINLKELEILKNNLAEGNGVNVVIVGEAGTGRKHLIENLAMDLSRRNVPLRILGKKILEFHLDNLIATSGTEEDKIYLLEKALAEAGAAGNIILYIPSIQNYLESDPQEKQIGQVDITPILTNFLENTNIQIITCATQQDMNIFGQRHGNLTKYFKIIQLGESDQEDCLLLMAEKSSRLENRYGKLISFSAVKKALDLSNRYFQDLAMPKRGLDFLEEAINYLVNKNPKNQIIKGSDIEEFASSKIGSPVGELEEAEKEKLINLEGNMQKLIVGQVEAVSAVASALRRRRLDLSNPERPAGCFLFLGPTGVGKTHTAEVLAKLYYGGEDRIARLDMSEYQEDDGVTRLLGDASGQVEGYFHKILSENPFNLILLDELEKAGHNVHQLLLQIMEEGIAKTGTGKKLNFRETIIIATSNAEALLIQDLVAKQERYENIEKIVIDKIQQDRIFSPEILNRFDEIIVFHPLDEAELYQVAALALSDLKKRLLNKEIIIKYSEEFTQKLAKTGFDPVFGARKLRRIVEKQIEDAIAKDLLSGKIEKGKEYSLPLNYLS